MRQRQRITRATLVVLLVVGGTRQAQMMGKIATFSVTDAAAFLVGLDGGMLLSNDTGWFNDNDNNNNTQETNNNSNTTISNGTFDAEQPMEESKTMPPTPKSADKKKETEELPGVAYAKNISWDYNRWFHPDGKPKYTAPFDKNVSDNYFFLALEGYFGEAAMEIMPVKLMDTYIRKHGRERLESDWNLCRESLGLSNDDNSTSQWERIQASHAPPCQVLAKRTFMVGRYSCPLEAGNRFHKYMNHLLWAMVTGRTFLSGYMHSKACNEEANEMEDGYCRFLVNDPSECHRVLTLSDWVPQYDDWKDILNLTTVMSVDGINPRGYNTLGRPYDQDGAPRVMRVGQQPLLTPAMYLAVFRSRKQLLKKSANRAYAQQLLSRGYFFVYGMLFESLFTLKPTMLHDPLLVADPALYQTWMLHSRHPNPMDGLYIWPEILCLEDLVTTIRPPCIVYTMSDRRKTLKVMNETLFQYNCIISVANHSTGSSFRMEHGDFAGAGFFEDLALVRHARHGFIAPHMKRRIGKGIRTSSGLLRDVMEFRRVLDREKQRNGANVTMVQPQVLECTSPFDKVDFASSVILPTNAAPQ